MKVNLRPVASQINMPTVIKTAILPGDTSETLFIATQPGEIYHIKSGSMRTFLDIRPLVLKLGISDGGYDERGLLGLAFHPRFTHNGLFYVHYSIAGLQGPGALPAPAPARPSEDALPPFFMPDPCDPATLNLKWMNRETKYDHIDTVEEWILQSSGQPQKRRTLLNIRRPFFNHCGVNSLNFSPETGRLVLTTGDGGSGYDPFNLAQDELEIAGKIIEIDVARGISVSPPVATRFSELPVSVQQTLTVIAKGVRNIPGISYQKVNNQYVKYVGIVGQDMVESVYSFTAYKPVPVAQLVQASAHPDQEGFINFGWRGWEGNFPTSMMKPCAANPAAEQAIIAYYDEAVKTSTRRLAPLTCYYHDEPRPDIFGGTALTGVQVYMGSAIPALTGSVVFTDFARDLERNPQPPIRGVLAYVKERTDCKLSDYNVIEIGYNLGPQSAFYVSLGASFDQTRLYLGVYGSMNVGDFNRGSVFEIVP